MKRFFFSVLFAIFSLTFVAQLSFSETATVYEHMLEVNQEWESVRPDPSLLLQTNFESEEQRIAKHLELVIQSIRSAHKCPAEDQVCELMNVLETYAANEQFPINKDQSYRTPIFIDHNNTACAVGHLMIESGYGDVAYSIQGKMNLAYVRELPLDLVSDWANFSGLSVDEMALIQPGYAPQTVWTKHAQDLDGVINDLIVYNGDLILGGAFDVLSVSANIAKIEFDQPALYDFNVDGVINDLEVHDGKLYAAGVFVGQTNLMIWDGVDLVYESIGMSKGPYGYKLLSNGADLFMSADGSGFAAQSDIHHFDGNEWTAIALMDQPAMDLVWFDNYLYATGHMTQIWNEPLSVNRLAKWNGANWSAVGEGIPHAGYELAVIADSLMVCGMLEPVGDSYFVTALVEDDNVSLHNWSILYDESYPQIMHGILETPSGIIGYGQLFPFQLSSTNGGLIYRLDYYDFVIAATPVFGLTSGSINSMIFWDGRYWAGGEFESEGDPFFHTLVATTELSNSVQENSSHSIKLFPNPAQGSTTLQLDKASDRGIITNVTGQTVLELGMLYIGDNHIDISSLSPGLYWLSISNSTGVISTPLVVE